MNSEMQKGRYPVLSRYTWLQVGCRDLDCYLLNLEEGTLASSSKVAEPIGHGSGGKWTT